MHNPDYVQNSSTSVDRDEKCKRTKSDLRETNRKPAAAEGQTRILKTFKPQATNLKPAKTQEKAFSPKKEHGPPKNSAVVPVLKKPSKNGFHWHDCVFCNKTSIRSNRVDDHIRNHTGERPFECKVCSIAYSSKENLSEHITRTHLKDGARGKRRNWLEQISKSGMVHLKLELVSYPRIFECDICGIRFPEKWQLERHRRIHTGEKNFKCEICPKRFRDKSTLKVHTRSHTGEKPYHCQSCPKAFVSRSGLSHHASTHSGKKPFKCTSCSRSFARKTRLTRHMQIHTGEKRYNCTVCSRSFREKFHLKRHTRIHTKGL